MSRDWDPASAVAALTRADPVLAVAMERVGPFAMSPPRRGDPFAYLARAIVYQQLSGRSAAAIHGRLVGLFPRRRMSARRLLETSDEALRGAGLSAAKRAALKDLAGKRLAGVVPSRSRLAEMSDEEILERLVQVRGIGPWTVQMLLMFGLGRADVLPETDLGIRKGFARVFGLDDLPAPGEIRERAQRWRPWRSAASWYLWRAADGAGMP